MEFLDKAGLEHLWAQIMNQINTKTQAVSVLTQEQVDLLF